MPRHTDRPGEETRQRLLAAGAQVLHDRLVSGEARSVLSLSVAAVLREANQRLQRESPGAPPITTGAVTHAFGGRASLSLAVLEAALAPVVSGATTLAAARSAAVAQQEPGEALDELARADLENMAEENVVSTREWLLAIAAAASGSEHGLEGVTTTVYREFDAALIPVYQQLAARQGRRLADDVEWGDLAAAFTTITEGLGLRHLADSESRGKTSDWAVRFRKALWDSMTEPVAGT